MNDALPRAVGRGPRVRSAVAIALATAILAACGGGSAPPPTEPDRTSEAPRRVWLDVDPAVMPGGHEPDDGVAMVTAFHSPEIEVVGVSTVFGNAPVEIGHPIAIEIARRFGPPGLPVHRGAAAPGGALTDAARALIEALEREPLTILVLGPATNLATALRMRPDLAARIEKLVAVIGRRPGQPLRFPGSPVRYSDFNFELDPEAAEVALASGAPTTLVPFAFAVEVPIGADQWRALAGTPFWEVFETPIEDYLDWFEAETGRRATYPFDSYAVLSLLVPDLFQCGHRVAAVRDGPADAERDEGGEKPWLAPAQSGASGEVAGFPVNWCDAPRPGLAEELLRRLAALR